MLRKRLTKAAVAKLLPPAKGKQLNVHDALTPGLILQIGYGGRKTWKVRDYKRTSKNGKQVSIPTTYSLGRYPIVGLKEAREKARQFLENPQKAKTKAATGTFRQVAETFLLRHVKGSKLRTAGEIERVLNKQVYPHWGDRPFEEIRRSDVNELLDTIVDESGSGSADYALAIIRKLMNWQEIRDGDYQSPVVRGMRRHNKQKRSRWLDDDEIRALWAECDEMGTYGAFLKVLLVTGQRQGKTVCMKWEHVVDGAWHIPREAREKGTPERLCLPQLALDVIGALPRLAGNPYVFAATVGNGPFNAFSQRKRELDALMPKDTKPWVLHDLRRTARKLMTRAGVRLEVAELALGHSIRGIRAHYDDPSEYQPMIDAAVQEVADEVERIVGRNVVRLPTRAS